MTTNNRKTVIEFSGVGESYQSGEFAIRGVSFTVEEGDFLFICGESGAGKSTMIKLMTGEIKPTEGRVTINGYNVNKLKPGKVPLLRRTLGVVFQDFRLIKKKTAEENVAFAMRVLGAGPVQIRRRVSYVMDLVGLKDKMNSYPTELSGGEQQRVAIARALVNNPSLIIADEPTGNLDPQRSYEIIELLSKINQLGSTVVVITHDYELLRRFAKRVIYMNQGSLVMDKVLRPGEEEAQ
ncbi:MAG: cell division ATP-binding protein FtsE [Clostridia bacterium]|nr:cell division ATP-binding protein FtsE [Oscillospiraceae bacterium]MBQ2749495.1 cell division ATP-binding protein FtsE [Clostridia bacterium]MBQ4624958.1 cell division ATP-binding protein FtsE [Clostridia bacterium]MBR6763216.1 cell division ATP-binding protein FtsE [Clostridia bacterium]